MLTVSSPALTDGSAIPQRYVASGAGGVNVSIPLTWSGTPTDTASFAVAMVDRARAARDWVHWLVTSLPATTTGLPEGASGKLPAGSVEHLNTSGRRGYSGPQPPPGSGSHPYEITVYALDVPSVALPEDVTAAAFESAVSGHVLASASITGVYGR